MTFSFIMKILTPSKVQFLYPNHQCQPKHNCLVSGNVTRPKSQVDQNLDLLDLHFHSVYIHNAQALITTSLTLTYYVPNLWWPSSGIEASSVTRSPSVTRQGHDGISVILCCYSLLWPNGVIIRLCRHTLMHTHLASATVKNGLKL